MPSLNACTADLNILRIAIAQLQEPDRFRLECRRGLSPESLGVRPGRIVVAIHQTGRLAHLETLLADSDPAEADVVALSVNDACSTGQLSDEDAAEAIIDQWETRVFTAAVAVAEKAGKPIALLALPADDRYDTILRAAESLLSSHVVLAASAEHGAEAQGREVRAAWRRIPAHARDLAVQIVSPDHAGPAVLILEGSTKPGA